MQINYLYRFTFHRTRIKTVMKNGFREFISKQYVVLVVISILIAVGAIFSNSEAPFTLIPSLPKETDSLFKADTYADISELGGKSTISQPQQNDKGLSYKYTINPGYEFPYAGLSLYASKRDSVNSLDLSKYNAVRINMTAKNSKSEQMIIKTSIPEFTTSKKTRSSLTTSIPIKNGVFNGVVSLSSMSIPDWWFTNQKTSKEALLDPDFSKVYEVVFQNGYSVEAGQEISIDIKDLTFIKVLKTEILTTVLVLLLFLILISSIKFIKIPVSEENGDSEKIIISYDRVEIEDEQNNDLQRITDFIASNYANPDFSVEQLAKGAGVSTSRIPTMLKKHFSMNFKQYLNTVRITEAKRLLLETDHQIVTIAHSVGYNNIPHFNRTFKQVTELSPKKYRENPEAAIDNLPGTSNKE